MVSTGKLIMPEKKNPRAVDVAGSTKSEVTQTTVTQRFINAVSYGYGKMISDTAKWLVIGLVSSSNYRISSSIVFLTMG